MRRFGRRRKPMVRWLQDTPFRMTSAVPTQELGTSVGVIPTTSLDWAYNIDPRVEDPAGLETIGVGGDTFGQTIPNQLLSDRGFRVMRQVGEFDVAMAQENAFTWYNEPLPARLVRRIAVRAGLCVVRTSPDGTELDGPEWKLGPDTIGITAAELGRTERGAANSWIWQRSWVLENFFTSGAPLDIPAPVNHLVGDVVIGGQTAAAIPYSVAPTRNSSFFMGLSSTSKFPSVHLGSHFDIKRHVTLKADQKLVWKIWAGAIDDTWGTSMNAGFRILVFIRNRVLIARAGRPFRGMQR